MKPAAFRCYPGGASHVAAIAGADAALDVMSEPLGYAGVSAGALVAIARAFRVPSLKIQTTIEDLLQGNRVLDPAPFEIGDGGIFGWHVVPRVIDAIIGPGRTMGAASLPLVVVVTDLDAARPVYVDSRNPAHKGLLVSEVARASSAIPGIAPQVAIPSWRAGAYSPGIKLFTDGGVTDNTADHAFDFESAPRIALRLVDDAPITRVRHGDPVTQAFAVFRSMLFASSAMKSRRADGLVIDIPCLGSGFDFDLSVDFARARRSAAISAVARRADDVRALKGAA